MEDLLDNQYIVCELANEKYALKIRDVFEIIKMKKITVVHNSKPFLEGVINLRGKIVPVVNLHKRLNIKNYTLSKLTRVVILKSRDEMVGVIVDKVNQVIKFSDIQPSPETVAGIDGEYFEGLGINKEGIISILKVDKVLYD